MGKLNYTLHKTYVLGVKLKDRPNVPSGAIAAAVQGSVAWASIAMLALYQDFPASLPDTTDSQTFAESACTPLRTSEP